MSRCLGIFLIVLAGLCMMTGANCPTRAATPMPAPLPGTPCDTGGPATGIIGQTMMDANHVDVLACLYPDAAHNTPPYTGIWKSMATTALGTSSTSTAPSIANDQTTGLFTPAAGQVAISTDGTQRLVVDSSGRVGLGTSTPTVPLDVNGYMRLSLYASPPIVCDSTTIGVIALNSNAKFCICDSQGWDFGPGVKCVW